MLRGRFVYLHPERTTDRNKGRSGSEKPSWSLVPSRLRSTCAGLMQVVQQGSGPFREKTEHFVPRIPPHLKGDPVAYRARPGRPRPNPPPAALTTKGR